jgi:hypothetical protein
MLSLPLQFQVPRSSFSILLVNGDVANAEIALEANPSDGRVHVSGAEWEIDLSHPVWFMVAR